MKAGRMLAGLVGFAGGSAVVVSALMFELQARGLPLRGSLIALQTQSVLVWVVESLPFLIAFAAVSLAATAEAAVVGRAPGAAPGPLPPPEPAPLPPPPPRVATTVPGQVVALPAPSRSGRSADVVPEPASEPRRTALEELVKVLRSTASRATEESRSKSAYLASMSRELRGPLNEIIGRAEALLEEHDSDASTAGLQQINAAARHIVGIVNNLLDLSRIEVGSMSLVVEDVDLAQVVDESRAGLAPLIAQTGCEVVVSMGEGGRFARADHMRARQIVASLLSHACWHSPGGRVELDVETTEVEQEPWVAVRVKDTGEGMTEEQTERVFDDYQPTSPSEETTAGRSDGGLGLSVGRKLAELMGGRLVVESVLGRGTTFSLLLPPASIDEQAVPPRSTVALDERLAGIPLLLVDDDPGAEALGAFLTDAGLEVEVVAPSDTAAEAIEGREPRIAVLGAEVPDVWAAAESLIEREVKVVVLSLRDEDVEMALKLGVTGFLVRPVERSLVLATLERCLEEE